MVIVWLLFSEPTPASTDWTSLLTHHLRCCTRNSLWLWKRPQPSASNDFTIVCSFSISILPRQLKGLPHLHHHSHRHHGCIDGGASRHQNCCVRHLLPYNFIEWHNRVITIFIIITVTVQFHHHQLVTVVWKTSSREQSCDMHNTSVCCVDKLFRTRNWLPVVNLPHLPLFLKQTTTMSNDRKQRYFGCWRCGYPVNCRSETFCCCTVTAITVVGPRSKTWTILCFLGYSLLWSFLGWY